jgi:hypothetical protein
VSHLKRSPARVAPFYRHGPGTNGCFTTNRTKLLARGLTVTPKAQALLARLELERVFGSEPLPQGVPFRLVPRKEMGR